MGEVIAILSGKGGTGKTTVCAGIASALTMAGRKVLCVDCDVGLRNLDIALGMTNEGALSFMEVSEGNYSLDWATQHIAFPELYFLTAPITEKAENVDQEAFLNMLQRARARFDYIFLDAPAGLDAGFELASSFADRIVLVTGAEPGAVRDATRVAQELQYQDKTEVRLVVNRVNKKTLKFMGWTMDDIMDDAGLPILGVVPEDKNVVLAAAFRVPLLIFTRRGAAKACKRIAKRLEGRNIPIRL